MKTFIEYKVALAFALAFIAAPFAMGFVVMPILISTMEKLSF